MLNRPRLTKPVLKDSLTKGKVCSEVGWRIHKSGGLVLFLGVDTGEWARLLLPQHRSGLMQALTQRQFAAVGEGHPQLYTEHATTDTISSYWQVAVGCD